MRENFESRVHHVSMVRALIPTIIGWSFYMGKATVDSHLLSKHLSELENALHLAIRKQDQDDEASKDILASSAMRARTLD